MKKTIIFLLLSSLCIGIYFLFLKKENETIKIGFVAALTGKYSVLGNGLKNGLILAFEEENYLIDGKKIEIIFKDDKQDEETNKNIINDFIKQDIKIIFGNATSSMSKVSLSIINKHKDVFLLSPTTSSNEFSKIDDNFLRIQIANEKRRFDNFTKYIINNGYKNIYGLYDPKNKSYTMDYLKNFEKSFLENGGNKLLNMKKTDRELDILINDIKDKNPDMILICANSVDTAKIIQYIRVNGIESKVLIAEWARTHEFLENTGKFSDGVIVNFDYDEDSKNPNFVNFIKKYQNRYAAYPSVHTARAYELSKIIIESLKHGSVLDIKKNILEKKRYKGLQGDIIFDEYGDVMRQLYIFEVQNGKYVRIK